MSVRANGHLLLNSEKVQDFVWTILYVFVMVKTRIINLVPVLEIGHWSYVHQQMFPYIILSLPIQAEML